MGSKGTCKATECNREVVAKGYCRKHFRLWEHGEMPKARYKICTTEKCRKKRYRGSLCEEHFNASRGKTAEGATQPAASGTQAS